MDNPYISYSYMTYLMDMEEGERGERRRRGIGKVKEESGGGGYNQTSKRSINFDGG